MPNVQQQVSLLNMYDPNLAPDENQTILQNMYLEQTRAKGKYPVIALPTPGLTLFANTGQSNVRCMLENNGVVYFVAGNKFGSVSSNGTITNIGTLNTSSGFAKMVVQAGGIDTNNQITIIDGTNGYSYNIGTSSLDFPIADANFPQTANDIACQDDIVIVNPNNSIKFQLSNVSDSTTWGALNFASKIDQADKIAGIFSHEEKLWLLGTKTTEIWYNAGGATFTFAEDTTTFLHYGLAAKQSIVGNENYFLFLMQNERGGYHFCQTLPRIFFYNPQVISTEPISSLINKFSVVSDCTSQMITYLGHEFYISTFPTANKTLVYDVAQKAQQTGGGQIGVGAWSTLTSNVSGSYGRWLGNCTAFCYNKQLVGDYQSGNIYFLDTTNYTENGTPIQRQIVSPSSALYKDGNWVIVNRLTIDVQTGQSGTFLLEKSLDDGHTWSSVGTYNVPAGGSRVYEVRLGGSRLGILFRITTTMTNQFAILGFMADIEIGTY